MLYLTLLGLVMFMAFTPATWGVLLAPPIVAVIVSLVLRSGLQDIGKDQAWRRTGAAWGKVGWSLIAVAVLAYAVDVVVGYKKPHYNIEFFERIREKTSALSSESVKKQLVRNAVSKMDLQEVHDVSIEFAVRLPPEQRAPFLNTYMGSYRDNGVIWFTDLLGSKAGATNLFIESTTLPLDEEQRKLFNAKRYDEFWPSLRDDQWRYIVKQLVTVQGVEGCAEVLGAAAVELPSADGKRLVRMLLDRRYGGARSIALKLAMEAGAAQLLWLFNIIVNWIMWLRGLPWLLLWSAVGVWIVFQAGRMATSQRLFAVNRQ